jgi:radical SAM protein with 4Fe4S-binding SPASM domain
VYGRQARACLPYRDAANPSSLPPAETAMHYQLNPAFHYVVNDVKDVAYIVAPTGRTAVVNADAIDLMADEDPSWQGDPEYRDFLESALRLEWLVAGAAERAKIRRISTAHHLRRVQYEIILLCNLSCAHCYCSSSPAAPYGQSTEFIVDVIRQASRMGVLFFDITGGEPLARKDLFVLIEEIVRNQMVPSLFTNCTLVTPRVAERLKQAGVASVRTSLDARTPELHDRFRGKKGAFDRTVAGIRALKEVGLPTNVTIAANRTNANELLPLVEFLKNDLKVPHALDRVIPAGRAVEHGDSIALSNREFYELTYSLFGREGATLAKVCDSPNGEISSSKIEPACGVGASYMFIKNDGSAVLCPTMTESESADFKHGDLRTDSLERIWLDHPTFQRYRGVQCRNTQKCPAAKSCAGGCRSNAYILHGTTDSPDEYSCNLFKNKSGTYAKFLDLYQLQDRASL